MAEPNTYNLSSVWKAYSAQTESMLVLSVFNGNASFAVFGRNRESKTPSIRVPLCPGAIIQITDMLEALKGAQPDTRYPFIQLSYNRENRTFEQPVTLVFFKDEKKLFGVEITDKKNPTPIVFYFKTPNTFSTGAEPMAEEARSMLGLRALIQVLKEDVPVARNLSKFNMKSPGEIYGTQRAKSAKTSSDPFGGSSFSGGDESVFG